MMDVPNGKVSAGTETLTLNPAQTHALFNILSHHETYREIESFKFPEAVLNHGYPFTRAYNAPSIKGGKSTTTTPQGTAFNTPRKRSPASSASSSSSSFVSAEEGCDDGLEDDSTRPSATPVLATILTRFILSFPGMKDLPRDFWAVRLQGLLGRLGEAELSDSYDKGALGTRKMLATGASGLVEMFGRGALGGVRSTGRLETKGGEGEKTYDENSAEDLEEAWNTVVEGLVHGDLVEVMCSHLQETDDLEAKTPAVKAAAKYAIIHLAKFLHHIFVLSPEGQYLLKLLENVHSLIPYKMLKQTLRLGNAASMINGMMRLLLAKLSVTSITNWVGLTANEDDGMNLLQRIIALVLSWDSGEFRKSADKVEKAKDGPSDEMLQAIREYIAQNRSDHQEVRARSVEQGQSIITAIFYASKPELVPKLTEAKHAQCLQYYSALLSIRDRESITTAFCHQPPDLFTQAIKDAMAAYDPMIRVIHSQLDLREHFESVQGLIEDVLRTSKPKKAEGGYFGKLSPSEKSKVKVPTVDDYVELLLRNRRLLYHWVHALAKVCPDLWGELSVWAKECIVKFRQKSATTDESEKAANGKSAGSQEGPKDQGSTTGPSVVEQRLRDLFSSLPSNAQQPVLAALDSHASYLSSLTRLSRTRLQRILDASSPSMTGPGVYISRWLDLLDNTLITPAVPHGPVRHGQDVKNSLTMGKTCITGGADEKAREKALGDALDTDIKAPDVSTVVREMGDGFIKILQDIGGD